MSTLTAKFDRLFLPEDYQASIRLFAKATGLYYLVFLIAIRPSWNFFFGWNGVSPGFTENYFDLLRYFDFIPFSFFWLIGFALAYLHFQGRQPEVTSVLLFLFHSLLINRNSLATHGEDLIIRMLLFYGLFFPWKKPGGLRGSWAIRLTQINLTLIYYASLSKKLASNGAWWSGEVVYYILANPSSSRVSDWSPTFLSSISPMLTFISVLVELSLPLLIWFARFRMVAFIVLTFFHVAASLFLTNLSLYSITMIIGLLLFLKDGEIQRLKCLVAVRLIKEQQTKTTYSPP